MDDATNNRFAALDDHEQLQKLADQIAATTMSGGQGAKAAATKATTEKTKAPNGPLLWIDLEMTGLDVENDTIIELACILTNGELEEIEAGPEIAIHHPDSILDHMNAWCMEHHTASGLVDRCKASTTSLEEAEQHVLDFVARHAQPGQALFAGNSVHVDVAFIRRRMPRLYEYMHYRIVDVSTVKELARRWFPRETARAPRKTLSHTALSDIKESIEELQFLRKAVFKEPRQQRR